MNTARDDQPTDQNIALLGAEGVGKTTLARLLTSDLFDPNQAVTHGFTELVVDEFGGAKLLDFGGGTLPNVIAEQLRRYQPVAAIIVIDSRTSGSTQDVDRWCSILGDHVESDALHKFLVISRCDIGTGDVDRAYLHNKHDIKGIYQTSAKDRTGIQELRSAVRNVVVSSDDEPEDMGSVASVVRTMTEFLCELVARDPDALQKIEWRDLERLLARAIEELGFSVELTPPAKDGGKDLVATCIVEKERETYYIEIKHWRGGGRPGRRQVADFVAVNARDGTDGGLFLSSSGFTDSVYGYLGKLTKQRVRLGGREKIVSLCQHYVRKRQGLWLSKIPLPELLFEYTLN